MAEAEEKHDVYEILRSSPGMVIGYLRPSSLGKYLHHYILSMNKALEVSELLVLVVVGHSQGIVEIVENLHADDGVNIEKEDKERHETYDNGHDFKQDGVNVYELAPNLKLHVL